MENVTSKDLRDKDNHVECECGNKTIHEYNWPDQSGECNNCPVCMVDWQTSQIKILKELIYELSPESKEKTAALINEKYAKMIGIAVEDFEDEIDYSLI